MNKPVYSDLSVLDLIIAVMCQFWYDYIKPKHGENAKHFDMNTDNFIVYLKAQRRVKKNFIKSNERILKTQQRF